MRHSMLLMTASALAATFALPAAASASCATAGAGAIAIRGPNYSTAGATAGCGDYVSTGADPGNHATAGTADPVGYTNKYAAADASGSNNGGHPTSGSGRGSSNLADGTLHASAMSTIDATGSAIGTWSDELVFTNTTGLDQYFKVFWTVEGTANYVDSVGGVESAFQIFTRAQGGVADGGFSYQLTPQGMLSTAKYQDYGRFSTDFTVDNLGGLSRTFSSTFGVAPGTRLVDVFARLQVDARGGSIADYGNTAAFRFGALPEGVSYTSQSGVFLSALGAGAVPEPASWALMILGFGITGAAMRRGRVARAVDAIA